MFGISTLILKKGCPDYCIMEKFDKEIRPSKPKIFGVAFALVHPLLNVFMVRRDSNSKMIRSLVLFARLFFI